MTRFALFSILSYVAAAPLTARISFDLTQTDWGHIATYIWWAGAFFVWFVLFVIAAAVIALWSSK